MKCLWLTRQYPMPADSGELIYSLGLWESLLDQGVDITLICYERADGQSREQQQHPGATVKMAGPMPSRGLGSLLSRLPSDAYRLGQGRLSSLLRDEVRTGQYDVLICEQAAMGWGLREWRRCPTGSRPRLVYLSHNREADIRPQIASDCRDNWAKRKLLQLDAQKYAMLEKELCRESDLITAITPSDAAAYAREFPYADVIELLPGYEIPSGVQLEPLTDERPKRVLLVGSFEWVAKRHNLERFLAAAVPRFAREQIGIQVVGKASREFVEEITRRYPTVEFHRNVPAIEPYLKQARLGLIAETVGGGFKLKTLDYVFHGLPLAALRQALGGVDFIPDTHAIIADDVDGLADAISRRIDDIAFLNTLAQAAWEQLADRFRWSDRGVALRAALDSLCLQDRQPATARLAK